MARWLSAIVIAIVFSCLRIATASAHLGSTKYIRVEMTSSALDLTVDIDAVDLAYELGLPNPDQVEISSLATEAELIRAWMRRALSIRADGRAVHPTHQTPPERVVLEGTSRQAIRITGHYSLAGRTRVFLRDDSVFDSDPRHESIVRVGEHASVLRAGEQAIALDVPPSTHATFVAFVEEGARHLVSGYDHILFLIALLLRAGERARKDGFGATARNVAKLVTGFTLGHSATLALAALEWVHVSGYYVEIAIAASIVWVAIANLMGRERRTELPSLALGLGLIHGLGFSSVLLDLEVPTSERIVTLVGFNLGIELAQLALVAFILPTLAVLARFDERRNLVPRVGSIWVALIASSWMIARVGVW